MTLSPDLRSVSMRDGCRLLTDCYVVPGGARRPSLLHRTLYGRSEQRAGGSLSVEGLVEAGFNVVVQDLRGCHGSDGDFVPYRDESTDTLDTIRWIRSQHWATQSVALIGRSYAGLTQWQAATADEDLGLDAIAPEACSADLFSDWSYCGGVFRLGFAVDWLLSDLVPLWPSHAARVGLSDLPPRLLTDPGAAASQEVIQPLLPWLAEWMSHDTFDAYWQCRSPASRWGRMRTPALCINGWHDPFLACTLRDYHRIPEHPEGRETQRALVIGPWRHTGGRRAVMEADLTSLHVDWFRRRQIGGSKNPVRLYVMGADTWLGFGSWPPRREMCWAQYFLLGDGHQGGVLSSSPPVARFSLGELQVDWRHPVRRPTAPHGYLPMDPNADGCGGCHDVLRFASAPLAAPALLLGEVKAVLWVMASAASFDLSVRLIKVSIADGKSVLTETIQRVYSPADRFTRVELVVGAIAQYLPAGERWELQVAGSNFPEFDLNRAAARFSLHLLTDVGAVSSVSLPLHAHGREEEVLS